MKRAIIKQFFDFCNERHAIYLRRESGDPWPWTEDQILQQYKFTNVYRELDAGTVWLRKSIIEPFATDPNLFFNIAVYRRHNRIATAETTGYITDYSNPLNWEDFMENWRADGNSVFTSAYMTCGGIRDADGTVSKSKIHQFFNIAFSNLWQKRYKIQPVPGDTLESAFNRLNASNVPGYGPFIWYEVVTDLRHTRYLENATDIMTWANPGPGAARGVGRLLGYKVKWHKDELSYEDFVKQRSNFWDKDLQLDVMRTLLSISGMFLKDYMFEMELRDIEHSLCEWDKYERARLGEGRPKQRFVPPHLRHQQV